MVKSGVRGSQCKILDTSEFELDWWGRGITGENTDGTGGVMGGNKMSQFSQRVPLKRREVEAELIQACLALAPNSLF